MNSLKLEYRRLRESSLARNATWMLAGQGSSVLLQAAYFILLARLLGAKEYGIFVGAFALVAIVMPYSGLGSGLLFMRYAGSGAAGIADYWGNIIASIAATGTALTVVLWLVAPHLLNPSSASIIIPVALANCICAQFLVCVGQVFQAFEQLRMTSLLNVLVNLLRLGAVLLMALLYRHGTAREWAYFSLGFSAIATVIGAAFVTKRFGRPQFSLRLFRKRAAEGFGFSFAGSTQSVYNDVDKAMLSHYGLNLQNGIYTLAYRAVDLATIPVAALDAAALPRYFRQSQFGTAGVKALSNRLVKRSALLALVVAVCLFFGAPLVPLVAGSSFADAATALRWLCLIPVFRGVHQLAGSALTGLGFQRYRTAAQVCAAVLNLGLNLWLIPRNGWLGAAWASLATDGALAVANFVILQSLRDSFSSTISA